MLMRRQLLKRAFGVSPAFAARSRVRNDPMQDQRHETDRSVRPNPLRQPVIHRADLDLRFQHLEAAFDVSKRTCSA